MNNNYPDIENDGMNGMVAISIERYGELMDCESRLAIALEFYEKNRFTSLDDIIVILGGNIKGEEKNDA